LGKKGVTKGRCIVGKGREAIRWDENGRTVIVAASETVVFCCIGSKKSGSA